MNWYTIFYLISVADSIREFFDSASDLFTFLAVVSGIGFLVFSVIRSFKVADLDSDGDSKYSSDEKYLRQVNGIKTAQSIVTRFFYFSLVMSIFTWLGYSAIPSKKDALIIVAGGAVGNFIQNDTSANKILHEVMELLRAKIKSEIIETELGGLTVDTLKSKTKEELIQMVQDQKKAE